MMRVKLNHITIKTDGYNNTTLVCLCGHWLELNAIPKFCPNCTEKLWSLE